MRRGSRRSACSSKVDLETQGGRRTARVRRRQRSNCRLPAQHNEDLSRPCCGNHPIPHEFAIWFRDVRTTERRRDEGATPVADDALVTKFATSSGPERVLHVLAGLLQVAPALVGPALGLQVPVAGRATDAVLDLAHDLFDLVPGLV